MSTDRPKRKAISLKMFFVILLLGSLNSCATTDSVEYVLYRTGIDIPTQQHDETLRIHVASFDALPFNGIDDNAKYNRANCEFAQELFGTHQPHYRGSVFSTVAIRYWCEKGRFRR